MENYNSRLHTLGNWFRRHKDWILMAIGLGFLFWLIYDLARSRLIELSTAGIILGVGLLLVALANFFFRYYGYKSKARIIGVLLIAFMIIISIFGIGLSDDLTAAIQRLSWHERVYTEKMNLYTYEQAPIRDLSKVNGELSVGVLNTVNQKMNEYTLEQLNQRGLKTKVHEYGSIQQMMRALKGQTLQVVLLEPYQIELAKEYPDLVTIDRELTKVESFEKETSLMDKPAEKDIENERYTVLITSSTAPLNQPNYRTYQCLVVSVDPVSQKILLISLPRNIYIPVTCSDEFACAPGQYEKLSLLSYHSQEVLRQSVESYLGIKLDYTIRVDLDTLSNALDRLGKTKVNNPNYYVTGNTVFNEGEIELNSVTADLYIRDFNDFSEVDQQFENNHLNLLKALLPFNWISSLAEMNPILDIIKESIQTDFSYNDLCEIINTFILYPNKWDILEMTPIRTNGFENSPQLTGFTYVNYANEDSINRIRKVLQLFNNGEEFSVDQSDIQAALDAQAQAQAEAEAQAQAEAEAQAQAEAAAQAEAEAYSLQ
ncbi:LCP family protein [Ileibacterium valens]|uniref:LCP family protein n=1 Tax=Ileibacterium valens TaxID=1862668 RepID=UPI00272D8F85|nr:LCP family protein [Ileibacterium valens]